MVTAAKVKDILPSRGHASPLVPTSSKGVDGTHVDDPLVIEGSLKG